MSERCELVWLFDLDNTLIPLDSDYEWGQFLCRLGAVDAVCAHHPYSIANRPTSWPSPSPAQPTIELTGG